jgi:hypothetical protein
VNHMGITRENIVERPSAQTATDNKPDYPHLMLSEKHLNKLGFKELPGVGTAMRLDGRVQVTGAMMTDGPSGKERMLHLDITHMKMSKGGEHEETDGDTKGEKLYGGKQEA